MHSDSLPSARGDGMGEVLLRQGSQEERAVLANSGCDPKTQVWYKGSILSRKEMHKGVVKQVDREAGGYQVCLVLALPLAGCVAFAS